MRFAIIEAGRVASITHADSAEFLLQLEGIAEVVDVTADPMPAVGSWWDGHTFTAPTLSQSTFARAAATALINAQCGEQRKQYITDICGQETVYQKKSEECDRWDAMVANNEDPNESLAAFPLIANEAVVRSITPQQMRDLIYTTRGQWLVMMQRTEKNRQAMHEALRRCETDAEIATLMTHPIDWLAP